ncbi:sensor histidine kinase [Nesterenkonia sp. NBAIMH1]|uniref:sensor histidine kinase n=1 Tax=Nesterenkonia sp. NBAIMH1 TaxID=2600320 RepID=UPI0011B458A3|nr:histidine kinase [Nesterenkonia sp. NBAIMH1]
MTPRNRRRAALRALLSGAAVVLMIAVGILLLTSSLMTSVRAIDPHTDEVTDFGVVQFMLGTLVLLTLPWYRRLPSLLLCAGAANALIVQADPLVLAVGLTVWMARARQRWHWAVAAAGVAAILANAAIHLNALRGWPDEDYQRTGQLLVAAMAVICLGLVVGIALWARLRRSAQQAAVEARTAQDSAEELSGELARERERQELAREVHDTLAGRLSGLSLQVGSLEKSAQRGEVQHLDDALRTTRSYADQALLDLRTLLTSLREGGVAPSAPARTPAGAQDLQDLFEDAVSAGLSVRPYVLLDGYSSAPEALQRGIFRITQEALTNALRHSSDRAADCRIVGDPERGVHLEVSSRSSGPSTFAGGSGTGLVGIRERAELLGGRADITHEDHMFHLRVELPWGPPAP